MRGDRLAKLREAQNLNQVDLSRLLGLGENQIWRYENGESEPRADVLMKIAQYFRVSADYLLGISDYPIPYTGELSDEEKSAIDAWRRGDKYAAIKMITSE